MVYPNSRLLGVSLYLPKLVTRCLSVPKASPSHPCLARRRSKSMCVFVVLTVNQEADEKLPPTEVGVHLNALVIWLVWDPNLVSRLQEEDYTHRAKGSRALGKQIWNSCSAALEAQGAPDGMKPQVTRSSCSLGLGSTCVGSTCWRRRGGSDTNEDPQLWRAPSTSFRCLTSRTSTRPSLTGRTGYSCGSAGSPSLGSGC